LFWYQPDLKTELESLGYRVYLINLSEEPAAVKLIRRRIDNYYLDKVVKTPTNKLLNKHRYHLLPFKNKLKYLFQYGKTLLFNRDSFDQDKKLLSLIIEQTKDWKAVSEMLKFEQIKCIFTTAPFLVSEDLVCRVAKRLDLSIFYSVLSFDNPTTRGYLPFTPSRIAVWNNHNKNQLIRIFSSEISPKIDLTGPPQFDFYFDRNYLINEQEWRSRRGLPLNRPVIMYGANAKFFIPDEFKIVRIIDDAIEKGRIKSKPVILLRPHPTDSFQDWELFVGTLKHTYIERAIEKNESDLKINNKYSNFSEEDVKGLCSTLAYSDAHISYASTLALDGICFDKPQICPYFSPAPHILSHKIVRNLYHSEHYTPITQSGAVHLPSNEFELIKSVDDSIAYPNVAKEARRKLKKEYLNDTNGFAVNFLAQSFSNYLSTLTL